MCCCLSHGLLQAQLHKGKLAKARNRALTVGEQICGLRENGYFVAREREARVAQKHRLERQLRISIEMVQQEQEIQVTQIRATSDATVLS